MSTNLLFAAYHIWLFFLGIHNKMILYGNIPYHDTVTANFEVHLTLNLKSQVAHVCAKICTVKLEHVDI